MKKNLFNRVNRDVLLESMKLDTTPKTTLSFYKYAKIGNPHLFRNHFYIMLDAIQVHGRIYVSYEGVNGQISLPSEKLENLREAMNTITFLENVRFNYAIEDNGKSFFKLAIKVRDKIVADGLDDSSFDVTNHGIHLDAENFNALCELKNTVLVDMRNHYESEIGHFKDAITPDVETFRESLPLVADMLQDQKDKNIVMYCTGGIRCEKASAYLKHKGFGKVYQLNGGIIEYARQVKEQGLENKFIGKNFVFDERLGERISNDIISICHQCGEPCDSHINCANEACHILFIQCDKCAKTFNNSCSTLCKEFIALPEEYQKEQFGKIEFNGTKFGKGRYKANHRRQIL
jgi:UPF0176 protein